MFERVLLPTDFSAHSKMVWKVLGQLPEVKEVLLLHIIYRDPISRSWDPASEQQDARKMIDKQCLELSSIMPGLKVRSRVEIVTEGSNHRAIDRVAREEGMTFIAMGARGKGAVATLFLGSTTRGLVAYGSDHLLIMRYRNVDGNLVDFRPALLSRMLIPTDFSDKSKAVIDYFAKMPGVSQICLAHVVSHGETEKEIDLSFQEAAAKLRKIAANLEEKGAKATVHVAVGDPAEQINAIAESQDVSLIAISSQGSHSPVGWDIGNTAYDVSNMAKRPVLLMRSNKARVYEYR
jgi:nucleotide-binding universal stress UspA family protein